MNKTMLLYFFPIILGICIFIYGGYDDSPGAQLLGFIAVIVGIVGVSKSRQKNSK